MSEAKETETSEAVSAEAEGVEESVEEVVETEATADTEEAAEEAPEEKEPTVEEQLEEAKARAEENYNSYLRAVADLDTYRRRVNRERDELRKQAVAGVLESFWPIYENLGFGLKSVEENADPQVVVQGIQMVLTQFKGLLDENGIEEIEPKAGDEFDHNKHEAMQTQPSDTVEAGKIVAMVRKGFSLNGRLIRAASVIVAGEAES